MSYEEIKKILNCFKTKDFSILIKSISFDDRFKFLSEHLYNFLDNDFEKIGINELDVNQFF